MTSEVIAGQCVPGHDPAHRHRSREPAVKIPLLPVTLVALVTFGALTAVALAQFGYVGIVLPLLASSAGLQVLADLVIALTLVMIWMIADARRSGRNPWPWVVLTLLAGSFGPLGYLLAGMLRARGAGAVATR